VLKLGFDLVALVVDVVQVEFEFCHVGYFSFISATWLTIRLFSGILHLKK
jgi:hypothetical protein